MSSDDDYRRRLSNSYLDRRHDSLNHFRDESRRSRSVFEGLRKNNYGKVASNLGVETYSPDVQDDTQKETKKSCDNYIRRVLDCEHEVIKAIEKLTKLNLLDENYINEEIKKKFQALDFIDEEAEKKLNFYKKMLQTDLNIFISYFTDLKNALCPPKNLLSFSFVGLNYNSIYSFSEPDWETIDKYIGHLEKNIFLHHEIKYELNKRLNELIQKKESTELRFMASLTANETVMWVSKEIDSKLDFSYIFSALESLHTAYVLYKSSRI
ncbi:hypothetical protein MCAMS1_01218 [biofilm metagenome]